MKTNTKKASATKSKTTVKASPKAKVTAKVASKTAVKPKAKSVKPVAKAPAKKAVVAKKVTKPAVKAVKKAATPAKKAVAVKKMVKPTAKSAAKPVKAVKSAPIKAVKAEKPAPIAKKVTEKPIKAEKAPNMVASKPIIVKMPENQNFSARTSNISTVRPPAAVNKLSDAAQTSAANRPVYRPIQVINKPLAPLQPVRQMAPVVKADEKVEFKKGDFVVYPAHGVGEIEAVETQIIGGMEIKLYAIAFEKDRMRLKVPVFKAQASGLRRLSNTNRMQDALKTLQGRAHIRRAMWSRRAQEYETKINSGDPVSIAEVLRDLKRSNDESEQSYSERQIYQSALERLAREVAAVEKITEIEAAERLEVMIRGKRSRASSADDSPKEAATA